MSIQPDWWIREQAQQGMIVPFEDRLVREGVISYGLSSFGYDLRAAPEWRIFVNAFNTVVDPKNFDVRGLVEVDGDECVIPPNSFVLTRSVEYMRIPEDVMVVALGKSSYARCFRGDTRVALVDGTSVALEEMAHRFDEGERFFGYSVAPDGRVIVSYLDAPRYIGRDALVEIVLDDGKTIRCTPDHCFMTRDGRMIEGASLRPDDSLMPLYRNLFRGYEMVYQPSTGYYDPTHRLADEWNVRNGIYEDTQGSHSHHVDHDRQNNMPWNIVRMDASEHSRPHNAQTFGVHFDPEEHGAAIKDAFRRLHQDPRWRANFDEAHQARALAVWRNERDSEVREQTLQERHAYWQRVEAQPETQQQFWPDNDEVGRRRREQIARHNNRRGDIDANTIRSALDTAGSTRGAARLLGCDRSVFRRFPDVKASKGHGEVRNHKVKSVRDLRGEHDVYCLTVPEAGNFALEAGVFAQNCGIVANVTPLEPGWEGHVTLELSNTTPLPAKVYANEGIVQLLFFQGEKPELSYAARKGKYQGQRGVTLPKL